MKKLLILPALLLVTCFTSFAQNIEAPMSYSSDDPNTIIKKIETNDQFTIVTFENTATHDNSWVQLNKEIYVQTNENNEHYNYVKSENIAMVPAKNTLAKAGDKLSFKIYFKKVPVNAKSIDIIERAGMRNDGITFFNFYNISLTRSLAPGEKIKITNVVLAPPPPPGEYNTSQSTDYATEVSNQMDMYRNMTNATLDAKISYFKQPGKITEIAKLNKQYFDALKKEGFNDDQAMKLLLSGSLSPAPNQ